MFTHTQFIRRGAAVSLACALLTSQALVAGDLLGAPPPRAMPEDVPMHSVLYDAAAQIPMEESAAPGPDAVAAFADRGITLRDDGKVFVEIIGPDEEDALAQLDVPRLESMGAEVGVDAESARLMEEAAEESGAMMIEMPLKAAGNRVEAWLPSNRLVEIARSLPDGYFVKEVQPLNFDAVTGQGPAATNSDSYIAAGRDGDGLTIAVIDGGFSNLSAARTNGDAPASSYTLINYTPDSFESGGTHGTGCVEAAYDHTAGATWRIYKIDSVSDLTTVVTNAIAAGVDVISHSLSWYNLGWWDNSGTACSAANNASNNGILFFTSAGNRAQSHYEGSLFLNGDAWHDFSSGDETVDMTIGYTAGCANYYLSWSNSLTDLDLYLDDSDASGNPNNVVASSTNAGNGVFEDLCFRRSSAGSGTYHLAVVHRGGSTSSQLEIFTHNAGTWQQYAVAAGSNTSPSNATGTRVMSVGAVTHSLFGQPNGSNVISSYSSRGPTNSGMTVPDITGPTDTTGFTYPGGFGGTSCATPNAAGATTAFWSHNTLLNATAVRWLEREQADLWRDWGAAGDDTLYGKGGVQFADYAYGTRWLARSYGNRR